MACACPERRRPFSYELPAGSNERPRQWFVLGEANTSRSHFNGRHPRWSAKSYVCCRVCGAHWKTTMSVAGWPVSEFFPSRQEPTVEPI